MIICMRVKTHVLVDANTVLSPLADADVWENTITYVDTVTYCHSVFGVLILITVCNM
jgi:hypothetical protein